MCAIPVPHKASMMANVSNLSPCEVKAGVSDAQKHPQLLDRSRSAQATENHLLEKKIKQMFCLKLIICYINYSRLLRVKTYKYHARIHTYTHLKKSCREKDEKIIFWFALLLLKY